MIEKLRDTIAEVYKEYYYKLELHAHSMPVSQCSHLEPKEIVKKYKDEGFDGFVLTNHYTPDIREGHETGEKWSELFIENYEEIRALAEGQGIDVFFGAEIRFAGSANDFLVYGLEKNDIADLYDYIHADGEKGEGIIEYMNFVKGREDFVVIQAHPYRPHLSQDFLEYVDGVEIINGSLHNNSNILALKYSQNHPDKIITAGNDMHYPNGESTASLRLRKRPQGVKEIAHILKNGDYIIDVAGNILLPHGNKQ